MFHKQTTTCIYLLTNHKKIVIGLKKLLFYTNSLVKLLSNSLLSDSLLSDS